MGSPTVPEKGRMRSIERKFPKGDVLTIIVNSDWSGEAIVLLSNVSLSDSCKLISEMKGPAIGLLRGELDSWFGKLNIEQWWGRAVSFAVETYMQDRFSDFASDLGVP